MGREEERFDLPEYGRGAALNMQATTGLLSLDWSRELAGSAGTVPVLTAGALVSSDSELPPDHMVIMASLTAALTLMYGLAHPIQGSQPGCVVLQSLVYSLSRMHAVSTWLLCGSCK